jgi:uncharacterized RDD family membrane protein YckC
MAPVFRSPDSTTRYAGFGIRTVATLIDTVLLTLITLPPLLFLYGPRPAATGLLPGPSPRSDLADLVFTWILPAVLVILFWRWKQGTPGKLLFRLRIVDGVTGGDPSLRQWCLRYLGYFVSSLPLGLGFLWVAWDPRHQGWHDKIAGTVVIRLRR